MNSIYHDERLRFTVHFCNKLLKIRLKTVQNQTDQIFKQLFMEVIMRCDVCNYTTASQEHATYSLEVKNDNYSNQNWWCYQIDLMHSDWTHQLSVC